MEIDRLAPQAEEAVLSVKHSVVNHLKIMITGSRGQLGTELVRQLRNEHGAIGALQDGYGAVEIDAVDMGQLDITDHAAVTQYITESCPQIVFHCAAMTNVDGCEEDPGQAERVNGIAVKYIAQACEAVGAKLVFVSTDYVFSGDKGSPYTVDDPCVPQTAYGHSKWLGEQNALEYCSRTLVVRTAWLYGFHGKNFVKAVLWKARKTDAIDVVSDQYGNPTNAEDLACHMLMLASTERYGIYHCTGNGVCSRYEFAQEIVRLAKLACQVRPCTSAEYPQKAQRPAYSALDHSSLQAVVGDNMRPWQEALKDYISKLEEMA